MTIAEYFEAIAERLVLASWVTDFKILKQVDRSSNGHLRARVTFTDNSQLEFSEFVEQDSTGEIQLVTYSYHWATETDQLRRRWDNAPHFPGLVNFPHHIHIGAEAPVAGASINIFGVLEEIEKTLSD